MAAYNTAPGYLAGDLVPLDGAAGLIHNTAPHKERNRLLNGVLRLLAARRLGGARGNNTRDKRKPRIIDEAVGDGFPGGGLSTNIVHDGFLPRGLFQELCTIATNKLATRAINMLHIGALAANPAAIPDTTRARVIKIGVVRDGAPTHHACNAGAALVLDGPRGRPLKRPTLGGRGLLPEPCVREVVFFPGRRGLDTEVPGDSLMHGAVARRARKSTKQSEREL